MASQTRNDNGFVTLSRQLLDWRFAQFPYALALWVQLIMRANWKDSWFLGERIPRGSLATSTASLADMTGMSESTVRRWLKKFEEDGQITRKATNRFTVINITNYRAFQDIPEDRVNNQVNEQMTERMNEQVTEQVSNQVNEQVNNNRTKKQSNKETKKQVFIRPSLDDVRQYIRENYLSVDPERFFDYYEANGWKISGKSQMKDWKAAVRNWNRRDQEKKPGSHVVIPKPDYIITEAEKEERAKKMTEEDLPF